VQRACIALVLSLSFSTAYAADIALVGSAAIPGTAFDRSALTGTIHTNDGQDLELPNNLFGSAGSAIEYTGTNDLYLMASDRGPNDGNAQYRDRVHVVRLAVHPGTATPLAASIIETTLLADQSGTPFTGSSAAFAANGKPALRLDPEGVRMAHDPAAPGDFWISDEYGPYLYRFNHEGHRVAAINLPVGFTPVSPSADADQEMSTNPTGRITNRGMEGLAITPDGRTLVGLMQNALLQDHALDAAHKRISTFTRLITIRLADGETHQYVYPLDSIKNGCNEILAINDREFLVVERDSTVGADSASKKIYRINLTNATDISRSFEVEGKTIDYSGTTAANGLPAAGPLQGVHLITKESFIDLLDPAFKLAGKDFPEKIEGLAWGPDFDNGDKLLIVASDNDFATANPTCFFAFRIAHLQSLRAANP